MNVFCLTIRVELLPLCQKINLRFIEKILPFLKKKEYHFHLKPSISTNDYTAFWQNHIETTAYSKEEMEYYAIRGFDDGYEEQFDFLIPRHLTSKFHMSGTGVHLCCYEIKNTKPYFWIAIRAYTKDEYGGLFDNTVAGGVGWYLNQNRYTPYDILLKEAQEEASIPYTTARKSLMQAEIHYCNYANNQIKPDRILAYHLDLTNEAKPSINDNEVEEFRLVSKDELIDMLSTPETFKFNCALPWFMTLIYNEYLSSGLNETEYLAAITRLQNSESPFKTGKHKFKE